MAKYKVLDNFYKSDKWINFRECYIIDRAVEDDGWICDYCGKPIDKSDDITLHHVKELTPNNVNDAMIALNPNNIQQVHHGCHNKIHKHASANSKKVYIVYGPPLAGKAAWVDDRAWVGDLIIDMDSLYEALTGLPRYNKPNTVLLNVLSVRDQLIDQVKTRYGRWDNAYIIGGYPDKYLRDALAKELGAELVFIDSDRNDCIARLANDAYRRRHKTEWTKYIDKWFDKYIA